jgi:hypothetical protein
VAALAVPSMGITNLKFVWPCGESERGPQIRFLRAGRFYRGPLLKFVI